MSDWTRFVSLHAPGRDVLPAYVRALEAGWSPNTMRDVAPEQLAAIAADPDIFLAGLNGGGGKIRLHDGSEVARLPAHQFDDQIVAQHPADRTIALRRFVLAPRI